MDLPINHDIMSHAKLKLKPLTQRNLKLSNLKIRLGFNNAIRKHYMI